MSTIDRPPSALARGSGKCDVRGLVVRDPHLSLILSGEKTWEIRGSTTRNRGPVVLLKSGTGLAYGTVDIECALGPLELSDLVAAPELPVPQRDGLRRSGLPYPRTYAYVLARPRRFVKPIPYVHPAGAVIWVRLPDFDLDAIPSRSLG